MMIYLMKESESYKTVVEIKDFDVYFTNLKEKLQGELLELQIKIETI